MKTPIFAHDTEILITGGTGSLGKTLVKTLMKYHQDIKGIRVLSRDELKQWQMKQDIRDWWLMEAGINQKTVPISYIIGDIRDRKRIELAMDGVTDVIHAAAMKQVPACEQHPLEAIKTNINGAQNILEGALSCKSVRKVIAISTDKAVYPINLYGMTKAAMEKLFIQGNVYSRGRERLPKFSCCRYGNVIGSRGSVVPLFEKQYLETGTVTVTSQHMTRFWIDLPTVAKFVLQSLDEMNGGEIFIPRMPSCKVTELAKMLHPITKIKFIGIRPGEKIHETLIGWEEGGKAIERHDNPSVFIIKKYLGGLPGLLYSSDKNTWRLTKDLLYEMLEEEI